MRRYLELVFAVLLSVAMFWACGHQAVDMHKGESPSAEYSVNMADDDWDEYLKLKERYYYLDKQNFKKISCTIESPMMADLIEQVREYFEPLEDQIEIRENLSSFGLTYSTNSGLSFSDPQFDVLIKDAEGLVDLESIKNGIEMMKTGFKIHIKGVKEVFNGIFNDYVSPQRGIYKNVVFNENQGSPIVKYVMENNNVVERYFDNIIEISQDGISMKVTSTQEYMTLPSGKRILKKGSVLVDQPSGAINTVINVAYKEIEGIVFPQTIKTSFEQTVQTVTQKGTVDFYLSDCKIE